MEITKRVSEKVTFKNPNDQFHTREFMAQRMITIPDGSPKELIRLESVRLDFELRQEVLTSFLLEGILTAEQMKKMIAPYKELLEHAQTKFEAYVTADAG